MHKKRKLLSLLLGTLLLSTLTSCNRAPKTLNLTIYQPLPSLQAFVQQETFFTEIATIGFNTIMLNSTQFSREQLEQAVALAHQANLFVIIELPYTPSLTQQIHHWVRNHQVDGIILDSTDNINDAERKELQTLIKQSATLNQKEKQAWGTAGYLIGRSHQTSWEFFTEATFGHNGRRKEMQIFLNTLGQQSLEQALITQNESPQILIHFHNLRSLYGERAQAITTTPPSIIANTPKSAPLLWFIGTLPQPFHYTGMLHPQDDRLLQQELPTILKIRQQEPLLQRAKLMLLGHSTTIYSDVLYQGNQQMVRVFNFGDDHSILNLAVVSNVVRGKRLIDVMTGEEIPRINRGFRIPIDGGASRLFYVR
ncbi:alpha-amylase family protein [Entomospira culicis]|uniref:Uncharacterized protein n=1 Tax=Entomospira culicis TaxID=2719989 RepID=A0A968KYT2_9SPIO|nr:alpha-amylase family protein [Entomospira culicis]NIZ18415.1 hypothetical protein [Entomospira culicis]NIZ68631.1 hypothetical protein [Entomospira culicis]WDI37231.1 alpha-amylase family protein [Entomospira culicis]WDI38859.1 alpha-amylase family protein [Entomospira culicis]